MGPASGDKGEYRLDICLAELRDGGARDRQNALKTLREIFDKPQKAPNVENLTDKAYHGIFEDIFKVAVIEKQNFLTTKGKTTPATTLTRLNLSIDALRAIIRASVGKLKVKTVHAIIDHITQTLPNADGEYCAPISHNYLKALSEILDHKAHVEHLKHDTWLYVVDFCLRGIGQYLNDNSGELLSRNSPSLNASYASRSIPKLSRVNLQSQDQAGAVSRRNAEDLLQCLLSLVSAPNAPVLERAQELADGVMSFLRLQGSTASQSHQLVFCITNVILSFTFVDKTSLTQTIAHDAIPIICQLWQGKTVAKDEMLNSVIDEMLILLLNVHLHLERSIRDGLSGDLTRKLVDLLDVMRAEYAKRSGRDRLQLDDLEMAYLHASANASPFQLNTFQLKPHNIRAERGWAILQIIGILENLVSLGNEDGANEESEGEDELLNDDDQRSRKRRRLSGSRDRLLDPLDSADAGSRLTSLQAIPFILHNRQLSADTLRKLLGQLGSLVGDKRMSIDSWALLAIASCTLQEASSEYPSDDWVFLWQIGCRSLTLATTCRVASAQLHWILARDLVPYHDIAEDVNAMVTSADVNGPAVMCDSAVLLMMHLLHVRVVEIPGSSLQACRHVIRWLFDKWKSSEHAKTPAHVQPSYILDLLRTTLGLPSLPMPATINMPCGSIAHAWQRLLESQDILRYLLLLDGPSSKSASCEFCPKRSATDEVCFLLDTSQFREARKLILELLLPKCDSLLQVWKSSSTDHSSHISMDTFRTTIDTCISGFLLVPYFFGSSMRQMDIFKDTLDGLKSRLLAFVQDSQGTQTFIEVLLQHLQPYLPQCGSAEVARIVEHNPELLEFCSMVVADLDRRRNALTESLGTTDDMMDLDDEFPTQISHTRIETQRATVSRHQMALDLSHFSFNRVVSERLTLLSAMSKQTDSAGILPSEFIDHLLLMADEEVLACQSLICDVLHSDLTISEADALRLLVHVGSIMTSTEYERCETAQVLCVEVLAGLMSFWSTEDDSNLVEAASEIYQWFIEVALQKDIVSPLIQKGLAKLLLDLLQVKPNFGEGSLTSPRTRLLEILKKGNIPVKFFIGNKLPEIFGRYVLKKHDEIFMDVLDVLPTASEEGISFRLFIIAKLGARWSTLLRRCVYHILEVPGKEPGSIKHASRCLNDLSRVLKVKGPEELFSLFAPQVLFTWLEYEKIEDIPYQIFGYNSLSRLLEDFQDELVALMMMRGQEDAAERLARALELSLLELLQKWFSKTMAYVVGRDLNPTDEERRDPQHTKYEVRLRKFMQKEEFLKCINEHFPDIIAMFFNTIDIVNITKSDSFERSLRKDVKLAYAADIMADIKSLSTSNAELPDSQQPFFRAKYFKDELYHICKRTVHQEVTELYTPALVTSIARKLFDTIHPALGSLHACAVLRKVSVLISLSGAAALNGYPLEMLLQSVRPFITDPECADDAIGIMRYLLDRGIAHLKGSPSFLAGIALSSLGPLRVFLKSSQSTTTQESQYRATMTKAQDFHTWIGKYIAEYDSPVLKDHSKETLRSMLESAHRIRSVGNAEIDSPESNLLLKLLDDEQRTRGLLSKPSRKLALTTLSAQFDSPTSFRNDILGADALAVSKAAVVWKSCSGEAVGDQYLCWAARVLGRAFLSSGHVNEELLRESALRQIKELSTSPKSIDSRACLLDLVQALTLGNDQRAVGLAESALRKVVSASHEADFEICQQILSKSLCLASAWEPYLIPPSDVNRRKSHLENQKASFAADGILLSSWLRDLAISLVHYVEDDVLLSALEPILQEVGGFADDAFPFILHLVLSAQFESEQTAKRQFSDAVANWFGTSDGIDKNNLKVLINSILYLRTQTLPQERSSADRAHWLEIDYKNAAVAAANCGMFKTALLFVEEHQSTPVKSSRRSSIRVGSETADMPTELLLRIFKSIDDPDMYYGVQQTASLRTILSRLEYEKDGARSLAFRGAQYDSHLRRQDPGSAQDAQSLVKALDVLNLSGLSHSLLQSQQTVGMDSTSLESMFRTARKLEQWDIPVPSTCNNTAVTIYKAFQGVHTATDRSSILNAVNDSLYNTMNGIIRKDLSGGALRDSLQSLAVLTELDEVLSSQDSEQFEEMLSRFEGRSLWMKTGRFDDISQILSCRGTTLSTLSQHTRLRDIANVRPEDTRLVEVQAALLSSKLNRAHNALQESLSLATSLMDLIKPCHDVGLRIEAACHLEAANALWDQGEMTSSIGMLQALNKDSSLKIQTIPVGHSDLLSKIGHQISVARLEKPDHIIENYLQPALKELKGKNKGSVASQVFHQFAVFCDQQLEDPDSLEDLKRLEKLTHMKQTEVDEIAKLLKTCNANDKTRYKGHHIKAKQWLKLDREELQRQNSNRDEFLRQSLENYLLALGASDDHDHSALRFTALWLQYSEKELANTAVSAHLNNAPSRKFASLMNQLTSRLLDNGTEFQKLLFDLVLRICTDHPYHGMYQISAGTNTRANSKDDTAVSRLKSQKKVGVYLQRSPKVADIWSSVCNTNKAYCRLAAEKDDAKYKGGKKIPLKDSDCGRALWSAITKWHIPPPTMQVDIRLNLDYTEVPFMTSLESQMTIASGVSAPKIITAIASNGRRYKQLIKGGNDDLRQDAIMEQVFAQVSELLKENRASRQRNLSIRTYKVLPLTASAGVIEFVPNTIPLHDYIMPAHERIYPKDFKSHQCRREISDAQTKSLEVRVAKFRSVTEKFHPVMRYFFIEKFEDPDEWFVKRLAYTRSTAAISILGHVLGLGDRHGHNILLDSESGEVVHIDLGVAFEMGRVLPVPELVPFRLTRDIVDGMGITKTEGVFRRCCEFTLEALRENVYSISTILDVLRYDPLYSWSISPVRLAKLQDAQSAAHEPAPSVPGEEGFERTKEVVNEPSEADRALEVVNKKLSKTLSVSATVNDLINQATDERNLAVLYSGWAAYA